MTEPDVPVPGNNNYINFVTTFLPIVRNTANTYERNSLLRLCITYHNQLQNLICRIKSVPGVLGLKIIC